MIGNISKNVVIMTHDELKADNAAAFQRGVLRGRFEERAAPSVAPGSERPEDRLARFFREERPDLGQEGDYELLSPVEAAMHFLRREPVVDPLAQAAGITYAIQHNPNCPRPYLVRIPRGLLDFKPPPETRDACGFGMTFVEALGAAQLAMTEGAT